VLQQLKKQFCLSLAADADMLLDGTAANISPTSLDV